MFDVSTSLIRYWEQEFPSLKPHKNSKGDRRFTKQNIEELNQIYILVKEKGFTLEGAKRELKLRKQRLAMKKELQGKLKTIKQGLTNLKSQL